MDQLAMNITQHPRSFIPWERTSDRASLGNLAGLSLFPYAIRQEQPAPFRSTFEQSITEPKTITPELQGRVTGPVRLVQSVAKAWSLNNEEGARLLAYPSARMVADLLAGRLTLSDNDDRADRIRLVYHIHDTLSDLFLEPQDEQRWVRSPLPSLGNVAPLDYMMEHRIPGMVEVRQIVEQKLANR